MQELELELVVVEPNDEDEKYKRILEIYHQILIRQNEVLAKIATRKKDKKKAS